MKRRVTLMIVPAMLILLGTCFQFGSPQSNQARATLPVVDGRDFLIWQRTIGIAASQMVRVTVANLTTGRNAGPLSFQCTVFDQNGARVFQTTLKEVPPQGFRYEDIVFGDLGAVSGDPVTLRKQLGVQVILNSFTDPITANAAKAIGSLEIIDTTTGKTTTSQGWGPWEVSLTPVLRGGGA